MKRNKRAIWGIPQCKEKECCCKCKFYAPVTKHPCNKEPYQGSISTIFGWVCMMFALTGDRGGAVYSDRGHGMCEMFTESNRPTLNNPTEKQG